MVRNTRVRPALILAAVAVGVLFCAGVEALDELLAAACAPGAPQGVYATPEVCRMETARIRLVWDGGEVELDVLVADEPAERYAGYQWVGREFIAGSAMLFLFESPQTGAFHMCNVLAPLEIAWFRPDGSLLDARLMTPGPFGNPAGCTALYSPRRFGQYLFALELPEGFFARHGLDPGGAGSLRLVTEEWMAAP